MTLTTTTYSLVRAQMRAIIEALTPASQSQIPFRRGHKAAPIRAAGKTSAAFRAFEIRYESSDEPTLQDPIARLASDAISITVAYPTLPALYGSEDLDDLESIARADAAQIRDALFSSSSYVAGQQATIPDRLVALDTSDAGIWYLQMRFTITYYAAQTLT